MTGTTDDRNDPRLTHGADESPVPQAEVYLVLSDAERAKGFIRPYRDTYRHVGIPGPRCELLDLTPEQHLRYEVCEYVKFEPYPESELPVTGRYWTQAQLDSVGKGCGSTTTMGQKIAETYSREPAFYGSTYCVGCGMHRPVGAHGEFVWLDGSRVGT